MGDWATDYLIRQAERGSQETNGQADGDVDGQIDVVLVKRRYDGLLFSAAEGPINESSFHFVNYQL